MSADLIERLREYAKDWRERAADKSIVDEAADALAAKDTALSEMRAELAEQKRLYDVQIAGHRLSAKDATTNLIRATKAEAELEMWRKVKHSSHWQERATAAEAQLALARKALRAFVNSQIGIEDYNLTDDEAEARRMAIRALASQDEGEER